MDQVLALQRKNTELFIASDPTTVVLVPRIRTRVNGTVHTADGAPRSPQVMKLIMQSPAGGSIEQHGGDGTERRMDFQLLGTWDAAGDIGDHFIVGDTKYEVVAVVPDNGYERRFVVEAYGKHAVGG